MISVDFKFVKALLILFLVVLLSVGSYMPKLDLHLLRVYLLVLVFSFVLVRIRDGLKLEESAKYFFYLILLWICTGLLHTFGSYDLYAALKELAAILLGVFIILSLYIVLGSKLFDQILLCNAWLLFFVSAATVAIWELMTGLHLESSYSDGLADYAFNRFWVMSTFGNPNNYGAFMVLAFPFLILGKFLSKNWILKFIYTVSLILAPLLIIFSGSRGAFVALVFISLILFARKLGAIKTLFFSLVFFVLLYSSLIILEDDLENSRIPLITKILFIGNSAEYGGSLYERFSLYLNGIFILFNTYGLGSGPGSFEKAVTSDGLPFNIHVPNPHNFWIEIASQYGIFVYAYFLIFFLLIMRRFLVVVIWSKNSNVAYSSFCMFLACLGFLFASILNSSYISQPYNWFFLGSLLVSLRFIKFNSK